MRLSYAAAGRAEAWDFVRAFAADWSPPRPLGDGDGCAESELAEAEKRLGRRLPTAVSEAYRLFGARKDLTSTQDRLLPPDQLRVEGDRWLVYRVENQGCALWAVEITDDDDPPTCWRGPNAATSAWRPFLDRFSDACVEMVLTESLFASGLNDNRQLDATAIEALEAAYEPLGLPPYEFWALPGGPPVRWFAGDDILLRDDSRWLWVRVRTTAALDQARAILPGDWLLR